MLQKGWNRPMSKYETKDSGQRKRYESGMQRDTDENKPRFDLIFADGVPYEDQLLTRFAALMARGAVKYEAKNWQKASGQEELDRFRSSALRHMVQWFCGEDDEDHAAAVCFNLMGAAYVEAKIRESVQPAGHKPEDLDSFRQELLSKHESLREANRRAREFVQSRMQAHFDRRD
jgi:hypothetical protein